MMLINLLSRKKIRSFIICFISIILIYDSFRLTSNHLSGRYNFDGFNNETGVDSLIIPNIIHFIRFNQTNFSFTEIINIRAVHLAQQPDTIYIHTNVDQFQGKYWLLLQQKWPDTYKLIQIKPRSVPVEIYGRPLNTSYNLHHASDIERARILSEYGGIYLDCDVYVIQSLDRFRKYEMVLNWDEGQFMGSQVLLAHKDARFLRLWLDTFHDYRSDLWYYNGGELPTTAVLDKYPHLIHRVKLLFGADLKFASYLFTKNWSEWKNYYAMHVLIDHRSYMFKENFEKYPEFNETMIVNYNFTFGEMLRKVYFQ
ncbi:hypothetical protein I4U23_012279 [Adineta vaga]|nr:hypothetical protein I4U23_012279 [Adineta vaga]